MGACDQKYDCYETCCGACKWSVDKMKRVPAVGMVCAVGKAICAEAGFQRPKECSRKGDPCEKFKRKVE
jgi:hypothetical protein